jgi:hypothetical protein
MTDKCEGPWPDVAYALAKGMGRPANIEREGFGWRLADLATLESQQRANEDGGLLSARRSERGRRWLGRVLINGAANVRF